MDTSKSVFDAGKNLLCVTLNRDGDLDISLHAGSDDDIFKVISTLVTMSDAVYDMLSNEFGKDVADLYLNAVKSHIDGFDSRCGLDKYVKVC